MNNRTRLRSEDETDRLSDTVKRQKKFRYQPGDYTVSWICALHIETAAARAMLDCIHDDLPQARNDINTYTLGSIGHHNIVIASLPAGHYGTNNAATVASNIERSFPSIEIHLMVGIGGGAPGKLDLRLGDIVVGSRVMQYDLGKIVGDGQIERTGIPTIPPPKLLAYVAKVRAIHEVTPTTVPDILQEMYNKYPEMATYARPNVQDRLFQADFEHDSAAASCDECDASMLVHRLPRTNLRPKIHYEAIASSNQVMKHGITRDKIARELQVACFEMEAAGLMNFPYLIIRGICDYSDSHKNKQWQEYAAATAAAYAKEFLNTIPTTKEATKMAVQAVESRADEGPLKDWWQQFLGSLNFEQIDSRQSNIKAAYTATCKWFLQSPEYLAWIDSAKLSEHHGFLWLSGKPGAGKSTILKYVYTRVRKTLSTTNAVISFFFNARGDVLERSPTGMYRSLLLQLLKSFPDLQKVCEDSNFVIQNGSCPSSDAIQILFRKAISTIGNRSLTCFIDALDECDELQAREVVQFLEDLGQQAVHDNIELRICFSSRHYPYIFIRKGIRLTLEDQKGHQEDVERYIQGNLRADPGPLVKEVQAQILQKSAGVFMWVVLVVDILNKEFARGRMFAVKKRLAEIPDRLSDLFKDILTRDNENMEDLLLCLQWMLYAKRPLVREEFYFAVSTGLLGGDELTLDYLMTSISSDMMDRFVVSSSKGLAEVTKSNQHTIQFIHESVRDFLIKDNGLQELWPEFGNGFEQLSHDKLKQCCYKYFKLGATHLLDGDVLWEGNEEVKELRASLSNRAPFLQYATQNVLYHADIAASNMLQDNFLAEFELEDWIISNNLFERYKVRRYTANASLFYILADKGFSALIQTQLRHDPNCCALGERYRYPIFAALINKHGDAVQALLRQAASPANECDASRFLDYMRYDSVYKDEQSFTWAVQNGYKPVVEWLIERGADVNMKNHNTRPPLLIAVEKGHTSITKLLIERGTDVNLKDTRSPHATALIIAIQKHNDTMAEMLIEKCADINISEVHGYTPLICALIEANYNLVSLLLDKGADVDAKSSIGNQSLLHAMKKGVKKDIIQLLIQKGADVNAKDVSGDTPLLYAARDGIQKDIIQLLIQKGADINAKNDYGKTSLINAIQNSFQHTKQEAKEIIQLLVEKDANFNAKDNINYTLLIPLAIKLETTTEFIQLLIERGADINAKDNSGQTPLVLAFKQENKELIQLLIEKGADINATDSSDQTPLILAIKQGNRNIIQLLIEKGADTNALTKYNQTPLLYALDWGSNDDIIQLLIGQSKDINVEDDYGRMPLLYALQQQKDDNIIRLLIEKGADVNVKDGSGRTSLFLAVYRMNYNIARLLIEEGADVNVKDIYGDTPLQFAIRMNENKVTQLLIEKGADFSVVDDKGRTALNMSFQMGNHFITEFLVERGADPSSIGLGGTTSKERLDMPYSKSCDH
ncbi:uncharacterized protein TrAtP1_011755 [Trichoderma atroviride]|uniref:uncharacterized protein n=1 Tax=Hypocrea atroviridis TaxID=63577 RepID=UPI0033344F17|nr:hypothetical protein TrAtP1_011755 [Trichoderma atroviride]